MDGGAQHQYRNPSNLLVSVVEKLPTQFINVEAERAPAAHASRGDAMPTSVFRTARTRLHRHACLQRL